MRETAKTDATLGRDPPGRGCGHARRPGDQHGPPGEPPGTRHAGTSSPARIASTSARRLAASAFVIALPMPTATAPESRYRRAFVASTPPVAISSTSGIGPRSSRANEGPSADAGNSLTNVAPAAHAVRISVGVNAPGMNGRPSDTAVSISETSSERRHREVRARPPGGLQLAPAQDRPGSHQERPVRPAGQAPADGREVRLGRRGVERDLEGARPGVGQLADEVEQRGLGRHAPQHDDQPVAADGGGDRAEAQRVEGHGVGSSPAMSSTGSSSAPSSAKSLSEGIPAHGARHRASGSGQRRGRARRLAHRHAGGHRAGGGVGVVGRREAAPGDEQPLDAERQERAVGDAVDRGPPPSPT